MAGALAVTAVGGLVLAQPWKALPRDKAALYEAFLNVGVPRQYRELTSGLRPTAPLAPPPMIRSETLEAAEAALPTPVVEAALIEAPVAIPLPEPVKAPEPKKLAAAPAPSKPVLYMVRPSAPAAAAPVKEPAEAAPASAASEPASYRVQIAATDDEASAREAWGAVRRAFPEETQARSLAITPAQVKGRSVLRAIVAGFPSAEAARAFCAKLSAANRGCLLRGKG